MGDTRQKYCTGDVLYQKIADNLHKSGEELPCTPEAFHLYATEGRADIDYLKLINLDNRSFLEAVYILSYNTLPPRDYLQLWQRWILTLPKEEFQRRFINSFVNSSDFGVRHVRLRNCICLDNPAELQGAFPAKKNS